LLGRDGQAALLGNRHEVSKMPQLHVRPHACQVWRSAYKVLVSSTRSA
jgi:hypothetical protein